MSDLMCPECKIPYRQCECNFAYMNPAMLQEEQKLELVKERDELEKDAKHWQHIAEVNAKELETIAKERDELKKELALYKSASSYPRFEEAGR